MSILILQAIGAVAFLVGTVWLGVSIRRHPGKHTAEWASRVSHFLFWSCLVLPGAIGVFHPGLTRYDDLLGLPDLPHRSLWIIPGSVLLCFGLGLMGASNRSLLKLGRGAAAFLLTENLVRQGLYGRTRNPMSLGFYAACTGIGMVMGSLTVTLGVLFLVVPIHAFNLKYFEERELELRYGHAYTEYRKHVPFLLPKPNRSNPH